MRNCNMAFAQSIARRVCLSRCLNTSKLSLKDSVEDLMKQIGELKTRVDVVCL